MKSVGLSLMSLGLFGFGIACSDGDTVDDSGDGGAASGGAESGGNSGSGGDASGGSSSDGGSSTGGDASGGTGTGGSEETGGAGGSGGGGGGSEFDDLYEMMEELCRSGGYVDVELDLPSTTVSGGVGVIARSKEDVVEGDERKLTLSDLSSNFVIRFSWPASAADGAEVDAEGVLLSSRSPEYNFCFAGKALVEKDIDGEAFHIVASDDVTVANDDGTCTDSKVEGTIAFCVAAEF